MIEPWRLLDAHGQPKLGLRRITKSTADWYVDVFVPSISSPHPVMDGVTVLSVPTETIGRAFLRELWMRGGSQADLDELMELRVMTPGDLATWHDVIVEEFEKNELGEDFE